MPSKKSSRPEQKRLDWEPAGLLQLSGRARVIWEEAAALRDRFFKESVVFP